MLGWFGVASAWLTPAIRYAIVAVIAAIAMHWIDAMRYGREIAEMRQRAAENMAELNRLRAEAEAKARLVERQYADAVNAAAKELENARSEIERQASDLRRAYADRDVLRAGLRNAIAAYASGRDSGDTVSACQSRARALAQAVADGADLLAEGAGLLEQAAVAHDRRAAEVEALFALGRRRSSSWHQPDSFSPQSIINPVRRRRKRAKPQPHHPPLGHPVAAPHWTPDVGKAR